VCLAMGVDIVTITLYPQNEREAMGMRPSFQLQVTSAGRQMVCSSMLEQLVKKYPPFAQHVDAVHVARDVGTGYELVPRDARLYPGDSICLHIIPRPPEHKPTTTPMPRKRGDGDRLSKPLILTLCNYEPSNDNWPPPLPPTSVLLANGGFAHDHAFSKFVLPGTHCFWVIPGAVLAGPTPSSDEMVRAMLNEGVRQFVDLRAPGEGDTYEERVRVQYAEMMMQQHGSESLFMDRTQSGLDLMPARPDAPEFIKMPIPKLEEHMYLAFHPTQSKCDYQVLSDEELAVQCEKLLTRCRDDSAKFYIHCSGGHFRTGTVCSVLIGLAYELSGHHALLLYQALHDLAGHVFSRARNPTSPPPSPGQQRTDVSTSFASQTVECRALFPEQREQVVRLLGPVRDYVKSSGCAPTNKLKEADLPPGAEGASTEEQEDGLQALKEITRARSRIARAQGAKVDEEAAVGDATRLYLELENGTSDRLLKKQAVTEGQLDVYSAIASTRKMQ